MENENFDKKIYRCSWCRYVMDEKFNFLSGEEQKKYKNINLPTIYCKECYEIILKEDNF